MKQETGNEQPKSMNHKKEETYRIFTAFCFSGEIQKALYEQARGLPSINNQITCVKPENIHLTLHFFPSLTQERVNRLITICKKAVMKTEPFYGGFSPIGAFPDFKRPRIIFAGVESGKREIAAVKEKLDTALCPAGFEIEKRLFVPHVTIARIKRPRRNHELEQAACAADFRAIAPFPLSGLYIIKSTLLPLGFEYTTLAVCGFGKRDKR